jgi:hypothetical protein
MAWLLHFLAGFSFPIIANNGQTAPRAAFSAPELHPRTIDALGQSLAGLLFGSRSWRRSGPAKFSSTMTNRSRHQVPGSLATRPCLLFPRL